MGCRFSFPQIQAIQVKQLVYIILTSDDGTSEDVIKRLQEKLSTLSGVRLARSADTLGTLWEELSKARTDPVEKEPSTTSSVSISCNGSFAPWLRAHHSDGRHRRSWIVSRSPCFIRSTRERLWIVDFLRRARVVAGALPGRFTYRVLPRERGCG